MCAACHQGEERSESEVLQAWYLGLQASQKPPVALGVMQCHAGELVHGEAPATRITQKFEGQENQGEP